VLHTLQVDSNLKIRFKGTKNQITQWPRAQEANRNYAQSRRHPCIPKVGLVNKGKLHKMGIPPMCFVKKKIYPNSMYWCAMCKCTLCLTSLGKPKKNVGLKKIQRTKVLPRKNKYASNDGKKFNNCLISGVNLC